MARRFKFMARAAWLSAALLGVLPTSASAVDKSSLGPGALTVEGAVTVTGSVNLPKSSAGRFFVNFVVPIDHAINTPIAVRVYMQTAQASCVMGTRLGAATRRRAGQQGSATAFPNVDRITPVGGVEETAMPAAIGETIVKNYTVRTPLAASFAGLRPGDGIVLRIDREPTDPVDTCTTTLFVTHIDVRYTSTAATP
jgi:hypothetical protein